MSAPAWPAAARVFLRCLPLLLGLATAAEAEAVSSEEAIAGALAQEDECRAHGGAVEQPCALEALQLRRALQRGAQDQAEDPQAVAEVAEGSQDELGHLPAAVALSSSSEADPAGTRCKLTAMKLRYGQEVGIFALPGNASRGALAHHPCSFEGARYPHGRLTFECREDRWHYQSDTCALCAPASLPLETRTVSGAVSLPRSTRAGRHAKLACKGLKGTQGAYHYGTVSFVCQENGTWAFDKEACSVCSKTDFTLTYGGDPGLFSLPAASADGAEFEAACNFGARSLPAGSVRFQCRAGSWSYASDTCAACSATNLTVGSGAHEGTFELPRSSRTGSTFWRPCSFGEKKYPWGQVNFECREGGWAHVNQTCAACAASEPFNLTYGADVGVFRLPAAESEGDVQDAPCVFGATNYMSGVVRFACKDRRWQLRTVTCTNG